MTREKRSDHLPRWCLPAWLLLSLLAGGLSHLMAQGPPIEIAYFRIAGEFDHEDDAFIADILSDLMAQGLEQEMPEATGRPAAVHRLGGGIPESEEQRRRLARKLRREGVWQIVWPTLEVVSRGYVVRASAVDLRGVDDPRWRWEEAGDTAVLARGADFGEIEEKSLALSRGLARRMAHGLLVPHEGSRPVEPALLWCIYPGDPADRGLSSAARRLTLELPFYVASIETGEGPRLELEGVDPRTYHRDCVLGREREGRPGNLISGEIHRLDEGTVLVELRLSLSGINVPLDPMPAPAALEEEDLRELSRKLLNGMRWAQEEAERRR